jgi:hypothetical protein
VRLFFDENMPRPLRREFAGHQVSFVEEEGWKGKSNGELLGLVAAAFDVFLTSDANIAYQQVLTGLDLSIVVVPSNNLALLRANAAAIRVTLDELAALDHHAMVMIDMDGQRTMRRLDVPGATDTQIPQVPPLRP